MQSEEWIPRFWEAYDALEDIEALKQGLPTAQFLHRAIFNTGTTLLKKKQISHLRAFRMCIVKDSPDAAVFNHPGALTKLALWIGEALAEQEKDTTGKLSNGGRGTPLVAASLDEKRGVYVVVGTGGGGGAGALAGADLLADKKKKAQAKAAKTKAREESRRAKEKVREEKKAAKRAAAAAAAAAAGGSGEGEDEEADETESDGGSDSEDDDSDDDDDDDTPKQRGHGFNRFGNAFQDVVGETNARVRIDSFEHCVVEVKKEDLGGFLESLSMKAVVG
ncbi:DNA replication initiation factor Cdc45 [Magnaporthiopsis poae ATCC 64411]|uniref:DNA replication initiation factor Cdc45 n=1 Tax=Magnaporthiopsis poae (strain ATCC 64411 / 73-15) TaxID=644358 RepID=A0A0C4DL58_MAGP6|nr:DNA replication initiation factor Cdc45 [Magnaporthiopsis poae ATCC 64411]